MLTPSKWTELPTITHRAALVRGGTSKCWLFHSRDVPSDLGSLNEFLIDVMGARDSRQIDGVGGGTSTTSKVAIVRESLRDDVTIEYAFGQVAIGQPKVEWLSDCGNCATGIALFALEQGLITPAQGAAGVAMLNTNTGSVFVCRVDASDSTQGAEIPGVSGTGTAVSIRFTTHLPAGSLAKVFPSGRLIDRIDVAGNRVSASLVSAGTPVAFLEAASLGLTALENLQRIRELQPQLGQARRISAERMGIRFPGRDEQSDVKSIPKVGIVGQAADYETEQGSFVSGGSYDLSVRMLSMDDPHPAIGLTTASVLGVASTLKGSLIERLLAQSAQRSPGVLRVGTPTGVVTLDVRQIASEGHEVVTVEIHRSARTLAYANLVAREGAH